MGIILWIVFGALAGWIATMIVGRDAQFGGVANIIIGIVGAFVGGLVANLFGGAGVTGFNFYSMFVAIGGAVLVLWITTKMQARSQ